MTDNQYDIIREYIETKYPNHPVLNEIGAPIEHNKVLLPINAPSLNKIKPSTNELPKWQLKYKGPYVLSAKEDGATGIYSTINNENKLYTRGNGTYGQDISQLLKYMNIPKLDNCIVRGEFIMKKEVFQNKYSNTFANARNLVSGILNSKTLDIGKIKDVDFVVYEVIQPELKPSEQMKFIEKNNLKCVKYKLSNVLSNDDLSLMLVDWRKNYEYEIDGIVVKDDNIHERTEKNPKHAFAFKMILSDQVAEAKVLDIVWAPSKDGYLKPRVRIEPLYMKGVRIEHITAFNAKYVKDNNLGIGSMIKLIRSGDVIPHILEITSSSEEPKMPDEEYIWIKSGVDIMLKDRKSNSIVIQKNITGFFKGLSVESLGEGNVKRLIQSGLDTIPKIIAASKEDLLKVDGFKEKMASKIYNNIHDAIEKSNIVNIMQAANIFGRGLGVKKMKPILIKYPDILLSNEKSSEKVQKIVSIKGMAEKTAKKFVRNIKKFLTFMKESNLMYKLDEISKLKEKKGKYSGLKLVITGFRDKEFSEYIEKNGGELGNSVSKNTSYVIVNDLNEDTGKVVKAKKLNVPIVTIEEFKKSV